MDDQTLQALSNLQAGLVEREASMQQELFKYSESITVQFASISGLISNMENKLENMIAASGQRQSAMENKLENMIAASGQLLEQAVTARSQNRTDLRAEAVEREASMQQELVKYSEDIAAQFASISGLVSTMENKLANMIAASGQRHSAMENKLENMIAAAGQRLEQAVTARSQDRAEHGADLVERDASMQQKLRKYGEDIGAHFTSIGGLISTMENKLTNMISATGQRHSAMENKLENMIAATGQRLEQAITAKFQNLMRALLHTRRLATRNPSSLGQSEKAAPPLAPSFDIEETYASLNALHPKVFPLWRALMNAAEDEYRETPPQV